MERDIPNTGEIYRHFKNKLYQIVTVAIHSETKEKLVIYQALYADFLVYARPLSMFMSEVDHEKYPQVSAKYRFTKIDKEALLTQNKEEQVINAQVINAQVINAQVINEQTTNKPAMDETAAAYENDDEGQVSPDLLAFLEADTYEEKKKELIFMKPRLTDELINSMAASLDIMVDDGDIDIRFSSLLNAISMLQKYEITNRLR